MDPKLSFDLWVVLQDARGKGRLGQEAVLCPYSSPMLHPLLLWGICWPSGVGLWWR